MLDNVTEVITDRERVGERGHRWDNDKDEEEHTQSEAEHWAHMALLGWPRMSRASRARESEEETAITTCAYSITTNISFPSAA